MNKRVRLFHVVFYVSILLFGIVVGVIIHSGVN